jgi:hypothetical protein
MPSEIGDGSRLPHDARRVRRAGETLVGKIWRKPLACLVERSPRMVRLYAAGARIPPEIAQKIRRVTEIGETGVIIRDAIRRAAPCRCAGAAPAESFRPVWPVVMR